MERFCQQYVINGCGFGAGKKAAIAAGYSAYTAKVTAAKLMQDKRIHKRIKQIQREALRRMAMDVNQVMKNLEEFAMREPCGDAPNDRNTLLANVECGKILGAYKEKIEVSSADKGISLDELDLPLDMKKLLLQRIRDAREKKDATASKLDDK